MAPCLYLCSDMARGVSEGEIHYVDADYKCDRNVEMDSIHSEIDEERRIGQP